MEFTLDLDRLRTVLRDERRQAAADLRSLGVAGALRASQERHDARLAAAPDAHTLACRDGCAWCCHYTVDVRPAEAFGILDHLERTVPADERARVRAAVAANAGHVRGLSEDERVTLTLPCPLLREARCLAYPVRPQSCRNYHATDVAGCRRSVEEPDNLEIDPEFAPLVYQIGGAHVEAFTAAVADVGLDVDVYELNSALHAAWQDPSARTRFLAGQGPFPDLSGEDVAPEYDDLAS